MLGAGSWGTALAQQLARSGSEVVLYAREAETVAGIRADRENAKYFPGHKLDSKIQSVSDLGEAVKGSRVLVFAVPSTSMRSLAEQVARHLPPGGSVKAISTAKGLEQGTLKRMSEVLTDVLGAAVPVGVLSGPSFALEVMEGKPTAVTIAAADSQVTAELAAPFHHDQFRVYTSSDVIGVELGGVLKNIMAVAIGVVDGAGMGLNARAALITRGLAEMQRLVVALGGEPRTVTGLSGLGDLILTATGDLSRNRQVGLKLGRGEVLAEVVAGIGQRAEAVTAAPKALELARSRKIETPITEEVVRVLNGERTIAQSVRSLLSRAQRSE